MPDLKTLVTTAPLDPDQINAIQESFASDASSHARHALEGCIFGLKPIDAQTHVAVGEAYIAGNRLRLRAQEAIDLAGVTRPAANMVAWVTVLGSYATENIGTVTDENGVQHVLCVNDSIIVSLARGVDAADQASAVKPDAPTGAIVLCDIVLTPAGARSAA